MSAPSDHLINRLVLAAAREGLTPDALLNEMLNHHENRRGGSYHADSTRHSDLLQHIIDIQTHAHEDGGRLFHDLLTGLLALTDSPDGFIFGLLDDGLLCLHGATDRPWDAEIAQGLGHADLEALARHVMAEGQPLTRVTGRPPLTDLLAAPLLRGRRIVGVIGIANRDGGYPPDLLDDLLPFLSTAAQLIDAHRSEIARIQSEARFRQLLEAASEAVLLVDAEGVITLANQRAEAIFGYARGTLLAQSVDVLLPVDKRTMHQRLRGHYAQHPETRPMGSGRELHGLRADGSQFPVEISLSALSFDGQFVVMCFVVDITERKQLEHQRMRTRLLEIELEKEREIVELKQRFVSMVSHEFRTPLAAISTSCQIVERYKDRITREQMIERIGGFKNQIEHMTRLIDDLLTISRIEEGIAVQPQPARLYDWCNFLIDQQRLSDDNQHELVLVIMPGVPEWASIDQWVLRPVFDNLLSNALKYSEAGTTVLFTVDYGDDGLLFTVQDTGIGIPDEDRPRLFQRFHRASNVGSIRGTGLGLAIARANLEAHGGTIHIESQVGEGTRAIVRLPLTKASP